jgi:hypothetical protein
VAGRSLLRTPLLLYMAPSGGARHAVRDAQLSRRRECLFI